MEAMHARSGLAALASSTINSALPWMAKDAVVGYHAVDVLVAGSNPILAAAAVRRAVKHDLSVAVALGGATDVWPYDLAVSSRGVPLVEGIFDQDQNIAGNPGWRMAQLVRALVEAAGTATLRFAEGSALAMADRHPPGEILVHAWGDRKTTPVDPIQKRMISEFRSASSECPILSVPSGKRKTAIFAKAVVLVSMVDGFANARGNNAGSKAIAWPHERIMSFGSSAWTPSHATEAAARMVDDLVSISKLDLSRI
jgi:hypothetical protein